MAQMHDIGPGEAAERMRSCVFDTIIGHGDNSTMADLESHRTHFTSCFGELLEANALDKRSAAAQVSRCILGGLSSP